MRILVIDDDPDLRALLRESLTEAGYEVSVAENGRQGIDLMNPYFAHPARVIITDIFMPEKNGIQVIVELRHRFPEALIIAMTGKPEEGDSLSVARRLGADSTLQKPFDPEEMVATVRELLRQRNSNEKRF